MNGRPNILLIMADQMAADCIGAVGHPTVKTPNLDRLAEGGTLFENAYCASPVCAPSRAALATGQLIRNCGVYDNGAELSAEIPTIYHRLTSSGYETVGAGKFHFVGPDQLHGLSRRLTTDVFPANFAWTPDWSEGPIESEGMNGDIVRRAREVSSNVYVDFDEEVLFRSLEFIREHGRGRGAESSHRKRARGQGDAASYPPGAVTPGDAPFFLQVSFSHPHPPFEAMRRYLDRYPETVPPPAHPDLPVDPTLYEQWMITLNRLAVDPVSPEATAFARRCYYAMVSYVDDMVGRLLDELERHGLSDETVVIFMSDHGEMLGEKGLWYKRMYHEPSVRIPLIVRDPRSVGGAGRRESGVVSLVDLSAEVLQWAGIAPVKDADGRGLGMVTEAPSNRAIFEYFGKGTVAPLLGIRRDQWKLVELPGLMTLLYDIDADPHETVNLADREAEKVRELRGELYDGLDLNRLEAEIASRQRRRLELRDLHSGHQPGWDYEPTFPAAERYIRPSRGT